MKKTKRGGKRAGSGRPRTTGPTSTVSISKTGAALLGGFARDNRMTLRAAADLAVYALLVDQGYLPPDGAGAAGLEPATGGVTSRCSTS